MKLQGPHVTIRPMQRADLGAMAGWRPFADPLYQPFEFPQRSLAEHYAWYDERYTDPTRRLYSIVDEGERVIGSLTLREIDGLYSARLGITLGADYVSKGYGTEAMCLFLGYFFGTMGFAQMVLDVAATNERALRSYRSLGFRKVAEHYQPVNHSSFQLILHDPRYHHLRRYFRNQGLSVQLLFYDMALSREEWLRLVPRPS